MNSEEITEIIDYVNKKYAENVPRPVRFIVRKKAKTIENFRVDEMPDSLRRCTVEEYISIIQDGLKEGKIKF